MCDGRDVSDWPCSTSPSEKGIVNLHEGSVPIPKKGPNFFHLVINFFNSVIYLFIADGSSFKTWDGLDLLRSIPHSTRPIHSEVNSEISVDYQTSRIRWLSRCKEIGSELNICLDYSSSRYRVP